MSLAPPPIQAWRDLPPVWARWFRALFARVGGTAVGGTTDVSLATLASPAFTGTPTAPTAAVDTNSTRLATTAFVLGQAASAAPVMDGSAAAGTSSRYARADHVHPLPDRSFVTVDAEASLTGSRQLTAGTAITLGTGVAGQISVGLTTDTWHVVGSGGGEPAYTNSWVDFDASSGTRFKKAAGVVYVEVNIKNGTVNSDIFTLPAGYRPNMPIRRHGRDGDESLVQFYIGTDGVITLGANASNAFVLGGFSFPADQ